MSIGIPGEVQANNAALAMCAVKKAFPQIGTQTIQRALKGFQLPARFEKLQDDPPVVVDGAHTEYSVKLCVDTWNTLYGKNGTAIFGCALGKNVSAMAESLLKYFDKIVITTPGTFKMSDTQNIYDTFLEKAKQLNFVKKDKMIEIVHIKNTRTAIEQTLGEAKKEGKPVLGVGSFYLAAEIREFALTRHV
jgi:dihydrofolate synthase/folylpolyglutamate synthase